jgi:hypothetical protein
VNWTQSDDLVENGALKDAERMREKMKIMSSHFVVVA